MKVQVSHRLDEELLLWATEYGGSREKSRAVVIEEAIRVFRDLCSGGVADLPDDAVSAEEEERQARAAEMLAEESRARRSALAGRQAQVNAIIDRARSKR
jgi:hypothetical protein